MRTIITIIFVPIVLCELTSSPSCVLFDENMKTMEFYFNNSQSVPESCLTSKNLHLNWTSLVINIPATVQMKFSGCDNFFISEMLQNATKLRICDISYSEKESLEWIDIDNKRLKKIDASHNLLSEVRVNLNQNIEIEEFDLSDNRISTIDLSSFEGLSTLKKINLSNNGIYYVHERAFVYCTELEYM